MRVSRQSSSEYLAQWPRPIGGRPRILRGIARRCASIIMKGRGMRTRATATTAECSSLLTRIGQWVDVRMDAPTSTLRVSSFTVPGSSTGATATHGESGAPREPATFAERYAEWLALADVHGYVPLSDFDRALLGAWERANREALGLE